MGNTVSPNNLTHNINPSDYQLVGKFSSIRWGELFEMRNIKTGQHALMQEKYAIDLDTHQKNVQDCAYRMSLTHRNLAVIYGFIHNDTVDTFTNTYKLCIFLEHIPSNLSEVIRSRKTHSSSSQSQYLQRPTVTSKYFDEAELLAFMNQLIDVLGFLQNNGINQGDITPDVCLISSNGTVKLLDRKLIYSDVPAFTLASQGNSNVLLTPVELEALNHDEGQPFENRYKADVFRLGMTLLECATFKKSSQIYDWNNYVIDLETLATRLAEVRERYSQDFYGPLREMLRFEEHKRPDFVQLRQNIRTETVANTTNINTPRGEENPLKRSMTSMGPKLVANASPRPDTAMQSQISRSPSRKSSHDISANYRVAFKEALERGKQRASYKEKNEEDLEDEMVELEDNMKINHVPYTEEARISVGSYQLTAEDQILKRNSMKPAHYDHDDMKMNTRLLKTMSVSDNQSRENLSLKDLANRSNASRGAGYTQPARKKGNIFGSQKLDLDSKSMIVRSHHKAIFPETAPHSQWEGINFQNAINFSQLNKQADHRKEPSPHKQPIRSQLSFQSSQHDRVPTVPVISEEPSSGQFNKLKFNDNFQQQYFQASDDSPVSLHSQSQYITTQPNTMQTGDAFDIMQLEEPKQYVSRHNFKLPIGEDRNYANPIRQRAAAAAPDQRIGRTGKDISSITDEQRSQKSQKSRETSRGKGSQERTTKSKVFEDNTRPGFSIVSYPDKPVQNRQDRSVERKQNATLESLKYPISNFYKSTTTTNSSLNSRARSPQMFVHEKRKSFTGDSQGNRLNQTAFAQGGYQESHMRPYMTYKREEKKFEGFGDGREGKEYSNNMLEKSVIREEDESQKDNSMLTRKSYSAKKPDFKPEANINDRFELAMERSRRSKAIVRDMSATMRSASRSTDPMKRSMAGNGVSSGSFAGTRINQ